MIIKKMINYIKNRFYGNETIFLYSLKNYKSQSSAATIKFATNHNLEDILYFQSQRYIDIFKNFLLLGDKGYFVYLKDKCIHRSWVKLNEQEVHPHWAYSYRLKENEVFIHYCETATEARGKNIYPHVLSSIIKEKQQTGRAIKTFNSTVKKLLIVSIPSFGILFFIVEDLFAFVFGEEWRIVGVYAQIVIPLFFIRFVVATVSAIDTVMERQNIYLLFNIVLLTVSIFVMLFFRDKSFEVFLGIFSICMGLVYFIYGYILFKMAKNILTQKFQTIFS